MAIAGDKKEAKTQPWDRLNQGIAGDKKGIKPLPGVRQERIDIKTRPLPGEIRERREQKDYKTHPGDFRTQIDLGIRKILKIEDLEHKKNTAERGKISLVEIIIVALISVTSEVFEWAGDAANIIPVVGQTIWLFTYGSGIIISIGFMMWSFIRGMFASKALIKVLLILGGALIDAFSLGSYPETVTLLAAIFVHNHFEEKTIKRITKVLEGHL